MTEPFERSVELHGEMVLRVCRALLGAGADADDAWSETFLAALKAWPEIADDVCVQAWLVRVARNKAIDIVRARARHAIPTGDIIEPLVPATGDHGSDGSIWQAVAALPERQRLAIAYHYLGGLAHAETAELIGGCADAVRRAAADGMRTLRKRKGEFR